MRYAKHFNPTRTPQTEQADPKQVKNTGGGYSFQVDDWKRLERFLILGSEGGSYYVNERTLTRENSAAVLRCIAADPERAVSEIAAISESGRAPKNDAAIFALALAASHDNKRAREAAFGALPRVCRIATHLFQFVDTVNGFRGWGNGLRKAVARWYIQRTPDEVAYHVA
jgi:60 kDa SS-A/Ro ribonucleoprotein